MKQFILNKEPDFSADGGIVRLDGSDYRYLVRVRRLAAGEFFPALLPNGKETQIQILSVDNGVLIGKCICEENNNLQDNALPPIILFQALPKGEKMDLIVRQAAEGGITEIVPFVSGYSFAKAGKAGVRLSEQKFSRWERIIKEARQQSGSKIATTICRPLLMNEVFEHWKKLKGKADSAGSQALGLLLHHQGLAKESFHGYLSNSPNIVVLAIGPEGGFSDTEVSLFLENGFKPLTVGDTILRTETAALYFAAATRIILQEKNSWELKQTKNRSV